jgi:hypothetical protein
MLTYAESVVLREREYRGEGEIEVFVARNNITRAHELGAAHALSALQRHHRAFLSIRLVERLEVAVVGADARHEVGVYDAVSEVGGKVAKPLFARRFA